MAYSTNIATSTASTTRKNASLYYNPASGILTAPKFSGTFVGTADKASAFDTAKSITLSGDVTGTSASTGGWAISTTLASTGVAAGSYGLASGVTPAFGSSFNVPYITVDTKGRITSASTYTVKLPANPNVDTGATSVAFSGSGNALTGASYDASTRTLTFTKATYNNYTLPLATNSVRGGVKIGYSQNGKNYPVQLSNEQMFVNVPWTDNNTTYSIFGKATSTTAGTEGLVPAPAAGSQAKFLRGDGTWATPTNTTYTAGTGLSLSGTKFNHTNSVTSRTSATQSTSSPGYGGTFKVTEPLYDAQGHITGISQATITFPAAQSIPTTLPNPKALTIGSQTYTGSSAITITAADLGVTGAMVYKGTTSTEITDGGTQAPTINNTSVATSNLQAGNVVLYGAKEFVWNGSKWELLGDEGSYKVKQTAVSSPSASGNTTSFIDTISQDANGVITATKKTVTTVTQSAAGLMSAEDKKKLDGIAAGATANTGDITGVTAGNGLTGGGSSGSVTLNVGAGAGLTVSADSIGHTNSVTASTAKGSDTKTLTFGGTFALPTVSYDAQGHVTGSGTTTMTMPSDRLFVTLIPTGTSIPANANLNTATYMKVGRYFCSKTTDAKTLQNCPVDVAFMMEVYSPLSTSIDNETTGTWVYRIRKITAYNTGMQFIQYASVGATANVWTYGDWKVQPIANFALDTADSNGGSAATGSATKPIYINSSGQFTACTHALNATVPSDAKFTDTTYSNATSSVAGLMSAADKAKLDGIASGATANTGDITGVTAGNGLTGGGSSGSVTLNVGAGTGISVTADAVALATVSGLTAGTYGPSAAVTGSNNATMNVPEITVDAYGRVTKVTNRVYTAQNNTYTSLKNPNSLIVQGNGTQSFTYDGSTAKTLNIKAGANVSVTPDTNGNITIAATDTDTHYTTGLKVGATSTATANAAATNGNVYLNVLDNTTVRDSHKIVGSGATTVTSDANGVITINSTDTKYTLPTASSSTLGGVKIGSNINISSGVISVPAANGNTAGVTIVYPAASCTTFSSDSGTITPLAAQKSAELFAITRPPKRSSSNPANPGEAGTCTTNNIVRWLNAAGDVQDSKITIEDVTNTKDTSKKAQVISIPAEGGKKMVYGYCTDQTDGTSFIGGVFDANATTYPYAQGLAIGGTSGNLLWKGKVVATTDQIPTSFTITAAATDDDVIVLTGTNGTNKVTFDAKHAAQGPAAGYTSGNTTTSISGSGASAKIKIPQITVNKYGHVTAAADEEITITMPTLPTNYAKTNAANSFAAANTFNSTTTFKGNIVLDPALYGSSLPNSTTGGQLYFMEDNSPSLPSGGATNQILVSDASGNAKWHSVAKSTDTSKRYLVNTGSASGLDYVESVYTQDNVLFGAAWNDYAEFRAQKEIIEPGYCVASNDNGQVYKTTEKYQACDGIVSDTYGFAIGETKESNTPLAVAGRVLAYFEGNREDYHAGDTVCAGPNGKICKMTRAEIHEWPDRIIGIVSEIPQYESWGENNIKVNNRIWIKIK